MELYLIVPVTDGVKKVGDEEIHEKIWRVTGPHDIKNLENLKFYCVSYVWGSGTEEKGRFFNNQREISDQTRPALAAAIKAAGVIQSEPGRPIVEAFWIDAICIPQLEKSPERLKALESMGFIYSAATSVIIVLQPSAAKPSTEKPSTEKPSTEKPSTEKPSTENPSTEKLSLWEIIESVSSEVSPRALSYEEMQILEHDNWISRVWTYQELVNDRDSFFTTLKPTAQGHAIHAEKFFDCVGFSLDQWKRVTGKGHIAVLEAFHNLDTLEDTLADRQMGKYLDRVALGVLSNMALRTFDPKYPENRLLACLGALTQEVSWGPPSRTLAEIAEKLMTICESNGDYSFIYTSDIRNHTSGMRWRPSPFHLPSNEPTHLAPVANWHTRGTQNGHRDLRGFWLDMMVQLKPAETIDDEVEKDLERFVYGSKDLQQPDKIIGGIFRRKEGADEDLSQGVLRFLRKIGFKGHGEPQVCKTGLFFSQLSLNGRDSVETYAASGIRWVFGSPGLARWKEGESIMYCAGIFTGAVNTEFAASLLME